MAVKKRKVIIIASAVLFVCIVFFGVFGNPIVLKNRYDFGQAIKIIGSETITLSEITPFEWDNVYSFSPYTSKQEMENIIGFQSNNITQTVSEGMVQLLFVKGDKVVCDIVGYSSNLGYSISLWTDDEKNYCQIRRKDNIAFSVKREGDILVLLRSE